MTQEKINIAELLKDCPKGMELDCPIYENLYFDCICEHKIYPIVCYTVDSKGEKNKTSFNWYGKHTPVDTAKCVIFPKGKTTWEGFQRPFKDGEIIYTKDKLGYEYVSIFQREYERDICTYWDINLSSNKLIGSLHDGNAFNVFIEKDKIKEQRIATEEEKQKLFDAIKANGYRWNAGTKTLEKLVKPKFKVGDIIKDKCGLKWKVINENSHYYELSLVLTSSTKLLEIKAQDDYELVPDKYDISTLKPFDSRVLVRDSIYDEWKVSFWGCMSNCDRDYKYDTVRGYYKCCIPYEGNEHLLGKRDDCIDFYKTWTK